MPWLSPISNDKRLDTSTMLFGTIDRDSSVAMSDADQCHERITIDYHFVAAARSSVKTVVPLRNTVTVPVD